MKIQLKMSWSQWSKGHVFTDMPGGQARTLISRGIAEEFKEVAVSKAAFKAPVDRNVRSSQLMAKKA